ncbi:multidrug effflux MFS transporter [Phenylobacterium sp.]|jgi:DHA1 family bicyclomycin/chloramphenicol resistance-like MFS transporter|uniref:multidrug effflux MFS transporter n=1 Tax=Phenylobacterium sp. TaxID=1871053 RepID=UPI002F3F9B2B
MTAAAIDRPKTPWGTVVMLGALSGFAPLSLDLYLPSLPMIGRALHAPAGQTQTTVAAFIFGMAVGQLFYGPASDRLGRRPPVIAGVVIFVAASVLCAMATDIRVLIAARFVQALGGCAGAVVARAIVRDRFGPAETARMLSLMMLIMGVAPILAPMLGGYLITLWGWRSCFWVLTAFGVVMGMVALLRLPESRSAETLARASAENPLQAYLVLLRHRRVLGYALCSALNGLILFTYISAAPGLIIGQYGISPAHFGWVFGLNASALIGASQLNRRLLRRMSADQVLLRATAAATVLGALLALAAMTGFGGPWTFLPLLFALLGSFGFMQGNAMAGALNADPMRSGAISSLLGAASFIMGALGATLAGVLEDGTPRPMALIIFAAGAGSAVVLRALAPPVRAQA